MRKMEPWMARELHEKKRNRMDCHIKDLQIDCMLFVNNKIGRYEENPDHVKNCMPYILDELQKELDRRLPEGVTFDMNTLKIVGIRPDEEAMYNEDYDYFETLVWNATMAVSSKFLAKPDDTNRSRSWLQEAAFLHFRVCASANLSTHT